MLLVSQGTEISTQRDLNKKKTYWPNNWKNPGSNMFWFYEYFSLSLSLCLLPSSPSSIMGPIFKMVFPCGHMVFTSVSALPPLGFTSNEENSRPNKSLIESHWLWLGRVPTPEPITRPGKGKCPDRLRQSLGPWKTWSEIGANSILAAFGRERGRVISHRKIQTMWPGEG